MAKVTTIPLADIIRDRALQPRVGTNRLVVSRYAQAMREGAQFPPVRVYRIKGDGRLVLSDGCLSRGGCPTMFYSVRSQICSSRGQPGDSGYTLRL